jgi:hypothetical protein
MANIKWLQDFYNWATTVPETKPLVYAPTTPKTTTPKTTGQSSVTSTPKTSTPQQSEADINKQLMEDAKRAYAERVAAGVYDTPPTTAEGTPGAGTNTGTTVYIQQDQTDIEDYINRMKAAQRQARIASLDKAKVSALGALDTEQANVAPVYYDKRNQAAAASDVGAMNFAQYMAARGIKGAAGAMPEIYRNAGLQGQIGALDRQEAANLAAIERQRANIESGYASDVAAANADIEAQAMQAAIDQYNANRAYNLQQAQLTGSLGDQRTLAGQQFDYSKSPSNPAVQAQILANKQRELEIAAQEIQNSYLPETEKMKAQILAQQAKARMLDYDTALANLNQIKAQINATNALAGQRSQPEIDTRTSAENYYALTAEFNKARNRQEAMALLQANAGLLADSDYRRALDYINTNFIV